MIMVCSPAVVVIVAMAAAAVKPKQLTDIAFRVEQPADSKEITALIAAAFPTGQGANELKALNSLKEQKAITHSFVALSASATASVNGSSSGGSGSGSGSSGRSSDSKKQSIVGYIAFCKVTRQARPKPPPPPPPPKPQPKSNPNIDLFICDDDCDFDPGNSAREYYDDDTTPFPEGVAIRYLSLFLTAVHPAVQKCGVGKHLLQSSERYLQTSGDCGTLIMVNGNSTYFGFRGYGLVDSMAFVAGGEPQNIPSHCVWLIKRLDGGPPGESDADTKRRTQISRVEQHAMFARSIITYPARMLSGPASLPPPPKPVSTKPEPAFVYVPKVFLDVKTRPEQPNDRDAIDAVLRSAFPKQSGANEIKLLHALRDRKAISHSFVAVSEKKSAAGEAGTVVGYVAYTKLTRQPLVAGEDEQMGGIHAMHRHVTVRYLGLFLLAVHPSVQNMGVGRRLQGTGSHTIQTTDDCGSIIFIREDPNSYFHSEACNAKWRFEPPPPTNTDKTGGDDRIKWMRGCAGGGTGMGYKVPCAASFRNSAIRDAEWHWVNVGGLMIYDAAFGTYGYPTLVPRTAPTKPTAPPAPAASTKP